MIEGGYYIKAKKIQESFISKCTPCAREVWDYLLMKANFKETNGVARGSLITTTNEILEALSWRVGAVKKSYTLRQAQGALNVMSNVGMIVATKVRNGLLIKIERYDEYQDPRNYERHHECLDESSHESKDETSAQRKIINKEERKIIYTRFCDLNGSEIPLLAKEKNLTVGEVQSHKDNMIKSLKAKHGSIPEKLYGDWYQALSNWVDNPISQHKVKKSAPTSKSKTSKPDNYVLDNEGKPKKPEAISEVDHNATLAAFKANKPDFMKGKNES